MEESKTYFVFLCLVEEIKKRTLRNLTVILCLKIPLLTVLINFFFIYIKTRFYWTFHIMI